MLAATMMFALLGAPRAEDTSALQGHVLAEDGLPIPGVTATLESSETGEEREVLTDVEGFFVFPALPSGDYTLKTKRERFNTVRSPELVVSVGQPTTVSVMMVHTEEEGCSGQEASRPVINMSGDYGTVLTRDFLKRLPGR